MPHQLIEKECNQKLTGLIGLCVLGFVQFFYVFVLYSGLSLTLWFIHIYCHVSYPEVLNLICFAAPRMAGFLAKLFAWFLESRIIGTLMLYILKRDNLIHKVHTCFFFVSHSVLWDWTFISFQFELSFFPLKHKGGPLC